MVKTEPVKKFKDNLERLEAIASLLESGNLDLEDVISLYKEGMELTKSCSVQLNEAELKITQLNEQLI